MKKVLATLVSWCVVSGLIIAAIVLALPSATAYAAGPAEGGVVLENLFMREKIILNNQQERLNLSQQAVTRAQTWINNLQGQGKDVSALQTALNAFQASLAQVQGNFNTAQNTLNTHTGFDGNGKVADTAQAWQTLIQAGQAERQFHLTITQATINFRLAARQYLQNNQ